MSRLAFTTGPLTLVTGCDAAGDRAFPDLAAAAAALLAMAGEDAAGLVIRHAVIARACDGAAGGQCLSIRRPARSGQALGDHLAWLVFPVASGDDHSRLARALTMADGALPELAA